MRRFAVLLAMLVGLTGCGPTPATLRVVALDWITAYQVQQGDIHAARETAALARITDVLSAKLEFENGGPNVNQQTHSRVAAAAALAWAGDDSGVEDVVYSNLSRRNEVLAALAVAALAHARAGHAAEAKRMATFLVKASDDAKDDHTGEIAAFAAVALAWSGDIAGAREAAAKVSRLENGWMAMASIAVAQAQAGDFKGAVASAFSIPQAGPVDLPPFLEAALGAGTPAAMRVVFPGFTGRRDSSYVDPGPRARTLMQIAWLQVSGGDDTGALETAGLITDPAPRVETYGVIALELGLAGKIAKAARVAVLARSAAKDRVTEADAAYLDAQLLAAEGDLPGALEAAKGLDSRTQVVLGSIALEQAWSGLISAALKAGEQSDDASFRIILLSMSLMPAAEHLPRPSEGSAPLRFGKMPTNSDADRLLPAPFQAAVFASHGDIAAAIETATNIADGSTRNAALREVAMAQAAAGDIDAASLTIAEVEKEWRRNAIANRPLRPEKNVGAVNRAVSGARQPGSSADDVYFPLFGEIAVAQARAGDAAGARWAAAAATGAVRQDEDASIREAAYAQAAAGNMKAALDVLRRGGLTPWGTPGLDDPVEARVAAGGDGVADDIAVLADYAAEVSIRGEAGISALCRYAAALARLGARDQARTVTVRAQQAAKSVPELQPDSLACLAWALGLTGDTASRQAILEQARATLEMRIAAPNIDAQSRDSLRATLAGVLAGLGRHQDSLTMADGIGGFSERTRALGQVVLALADRNEVAAALRDAVLISNIAERARIFGEIGRRRAAYDPSGARRAGELAAEVAATLIDAGARAGGLRDVVRLQIEFGDAAGARHSAAMALDGAAGVRLPALRALCLGDAAEALATAGDAAEARRAIELGREAVLAVDAGFYQAVALSQLARVEAALGDQAAARELADLADTAALSIAK